MYGKALTLILFGVLIHYMSIYRIWLNWDRTEVFKNYPGTCKVISKEGGSEDVTHLGNGIILISSGYATPSGSIKALDLNAEDNLTTLDIIDAPNTPHFLASPHGISVWNDPTTGEQFLYVISHWPDEERVEVFEVVRPLALKYVKTITDPSFISLNDLIAVGKDQFYTTNIFRFRAHHLNTLEMLGRLRFGKVLYFDGQQAKEVASGLFVPNGINISPKKTMVYVAGFGSQTLIGFRRDVTTNDLVQVWEKSLHTGVDNIEVDQDTGNLWLGCHPQMWKIIYNFFYNHDPHFKYPSQVLKVKIRNEMVDEVEELFSDNGNALSGSSAATVVNGKLVIGTVFSRTMVCDLNKRL